MNQKIFVTLFTFLILTSSQIALAQVDFVAPPPVINGEPNTVAIDSAGNRFVAGHFINFGDFNPNVGEDARSSGGGFDVFVTRFNADGGYGWTQTLGGTGTDDCFQILVANNLVYVVGSFGATAHIGATGVSATAIAGSSGFVLALDASTGQPSPGFGSGGVQIFGATGNSHGYSFAIANGTLYVTGDFAGSNFQVAATTPAVSGFGGFDTFLLALDAVTGAPVAGFGNGGVVHICGSGTEYGDSLIVANGILYFMGATQSADMSIGALGSFSTTGGYDFFVAAFNLSSGALVNTFGNGGVQFIGGTGEDFPYWDSAMTFKSGRLYVTGGFYSTDAQIGKSGVSVSAEANGDALIFAIDAASGAAVTGFGNGGMVVFGGAGGGDYGSSVAFNGSILYVTGGFASSSAKLNGIGSFSPLGAVDTFVLALDENTGVFKPSFDTNGFLQFGGSGDDAPTAMAWFNDKVFVTGNFDSTDAGFGAVGTINSTNFGGFLLELTAAMNHAPVIQSDPTANPNPAFAGVPVVFSVSPTDQDGDALTISWGFGDDFAGSGASTAHVYTAAGTYTVQVTVSDGELSVLKTVTVTVNAPLAATPAKGAVKFTFTKPDKDSFALAGTIALPAGTKLSGKSASVKMVDYSVSDLIFSDKLTAAMGKNVSLKINAKVNKSTGEVVTSPTPKFTLSLKNLTLFPSLQAAWFTNQDSTKISVPLTVKITIAGVPYESVKTFIYSSKAGKSGSGK